MRNKVPKKVTTTRVITITKYDFTLEMIFVILQFALYVDKLCIEFIVLQLFRLLQ